MHSPVWHDYDPSYHLDEYWSDWDYYSDDYYDQEPVRKGKVSASNVGGTPRPGGKRKTAANDGVKRKRRRLEATDYIPKMSLDESAAPAVGRAKSTGPIVLWRSKESPKKEIVPHQGHGESVALLKNWREILRLNAYKEQLGPHTEADTQVEDLDVERPGWEQAEKTIMSPPSRPGMLQDKRLNSEEVGLYTASRFSAGRVDSTIGPNASFSNEHEEGFLGPTLADSSVGERNIILAKGQNRSAAEKKCLKLETDNH